MTLARRNLPAIREAQQGAAETVPHLDAQAVRRLIEAARSASQTGERNALLIATLYDGALRVSEALRLRPMDLVRSETGWAAQIMGKGGKRGMVALSPSLVAQLHQFAYGWTIQKDSRFWPITRGRVHQVVTEAAGRAGIVMPDGVGSVHVLRHSGAIARLEATGNPKALQDHLRHQSARMTLRYMKTLSAKRSLEIQQAVDLGWGA